MPNQDDHFRASATVCGLARAVRELQLNPQAGPGEVLVKAAISALIGGIGGTLPDLIEPATTPHHRGAFHSVAVGGLLASSHGRIRANPNLAPWEKQLLADLMMGFGVHLALDAQTPRGLPLLTRNL